MSITPSSPLLADRDPVWAYLARLSVSGRRTQLSALRQVLGSEQAVINVGGVSYPWWQALQYEHLTGLKTRLVQEGKSPATVNKSLSAIKGVIEEAWNMGLVETEAYTRIKSVKGVKHTSPPPGRVIMPGEFERLIGACEGNELGLRDAAMLWMLYSTGLRRSSVIKLDLADWTPESGELRLRNAKGGKNLVTFLVGDARRVLEQYLNIRGEEDGPLFLTARGSSQKRLTDQTVYDRLKVLADRAGVGDIKVHDFRRTFITRMLEAGVDVLLVRGMVGHTNASTTQLYDRRPMQAMRKELERVYG